MTDLARLSIAVDSGSVRGADRDLKGLASSGDKAERAMAKLAAGVAGLASIAMLARQFYDTNAEFQRLNASILTVTGSTEAAERAFSSILNFAKKTPYELSEVTQAFIDLKTRGMNASMGNLTAYGNMASSFGRSMTDLVRAVSGVAMGETEAIKSFGIQAQAQGDKIALTFKGNTEIIRRTVSDVEDYFRRLSDADFASGMVRQSKTLGGAISNLKDQIAATFFEVGNAGASDALLNVILRTTQAISDATPAIARFTSSFVSGVTRAAEFANRYKVQIGGVAIVLGIMATAHALVNSTMVASGVAFVAQTARTVALTYAVSGYSASATAAAVATAAWGAASWSGIAAFGALSAVLVGLYMATKNLREETARLDKEVAASKPWHDRAELHRNFADGTRDIQENIKTLRAALAGNKNALAESTMPDIASYRREARALGTEAFDRQVQARIEAVETEKALRRQLELKTKAAKEEEKLQANRSSWVRDLKEKYQTLGLSEMAVELWKNKRLGFSDTGAEAQIIRRNASLKVWLETEKEITRASKEADAAFAKAFKTPRTANDDIAKGMYDSFKMAMDAAQPLRWELDRIEERKRNLEAWRGVMSNAQYDLAFNDIRREERKLAAESGDMWAAMSIQVESFGTRATDAFVDFCFTGKSTFSDLITSMLRDLARLAVQQNVMGPLFSWMGKGLWTPGGDGTSYDIVNGTMTTPSITDSIVGSPVQKVSAAGGGGLSISFPINVSAVGGNSMSEGDSQRLTTDIRREVEPIVLQVIAKHQKPGGALNPTRSF